MLYVLVLNCNPPWISLQDQCSGLINDTEALKEITAIERINKTVEGILNMKNYPAKDKCKPSCTITRSNIVKNEIEEPFQFKQMATLNLKFDTNVISRTQKVTYNVWYFLIDIGSSLISLLLAMFVIVWSNIGIVPQNN